MRARGAGASGQCGERKRDTSAGAAPPPPPPPPRIRLKSEKMRGRYSVLNECPQEHDLVTFGLLILNPEPMRLSM